MANMEGLPEDFHKGLQIRREVLGDAYVDRAIAGMQEPFTRVGQEYITEVCWGAWGILMALNRGPELQAHTRGAIRNGLTETEIAEAIRHAMIYCGVPAGVDAFKIANKVIQDMKDSGEYKPETKK